MRRLDLPRTGLLVDLGCSDGFVIWQLRRQHDLPPAWCAAGYELNRRLLAAARRRQLPRTTFRRLNLNDADARVVQRGNLVLCLETLEHVGSYQAALRVLHGSVVPGGWIVVSMPNEVGLMGLAKLVGRPLMRRQPYADFFPSPAEATRYAWAVLTRGDLERFRAPGRTGWDSHLGFDHRRVRDHIQREFVDAGLWQVADERSSALGANRFLVLRRAGTRPRVPEPRSARARPRARREAQSAAR